MTRLMDVLGVDRAYVDAGDAITVTTRVTQGQRKKWCLQHAMPNQDGRLLATGEALLIHVDLSTRKSCLPGE